MTEDGGEMNKEKIAIILGLVVITIVIVSSPFLWQTYKNSPNNFYYGGITIPENDKLCSAIWTIEQVTMKHNIIEQYLREEIAKFGDQYNNPDRVISVISRDSDTVSVKIGGSWSMSSDDRPDIGSVLSSIGKLDDRITSICE